MDDFDGATRRTVKAGQGEAPKYQLILLKAVLMIAYGVTFIVTAGLYPSVGYKEYVAGVIGQNRSAAAEETP